MSYRGLDTCDKDHDAVAFSSDLRCPLCVALDLLREMDKELRKAKADIKDSEEYAEELKQALAAKEFKTEPLPSCKPRRLVQPT